ncbi:AGE family epimerase/isomerase [Asticcacaulis sp. EMRT-3]|uniref:AGE family epimerase/isomerase n=1 Tax=Asticcacaulis sp. EMRT-3 TaxID=3040349 RepID=UPI0024AFB5F4|nr:AGE family epimerase/isomerase [Asticcacaulis sp. EMRT-3]MDI7776370.1 AGE family epimerase/isomerase [Asticcacaulis sp. EMRT-3]
MPDLATRLYAKQNELRQWLFDHALPLWWNTGGDREKGGFFEKINLDGTPRNVDRRTRVAARQVFSYAVADRMGYKGETAPAIDQGLNWLAGPARNPKTGLLYAVLRPDGSVVRAEFDFYDHAFAMLAYSAAFRVRPDDKGLEKAAVFIRDRIVAEYSHPLGGFEESNPPTLPLKANPHMHMFEACLAWMEAGGDAKWREIAAMIADLCVDKFLNPKNGALREFFDGDWNPMMGEQGRIIEPGHQFEWAWLFMRWSKITNDSKYLLKAQTLMEIAETAGTDPKRGVTFNELWDDFLPKDEVARLWPQTERIKAYVQLSRMVSGPDREGAIAKAIEAAHGLQLYLSTEIEGLYHDRMKESGDFEIEPAPASSLYHITCAIDELCAISV